MPALFEELEGILGTEAVAKIPAEMRTEMEFREELRNYYDGSINEAPKPKTPARAIEPQRTEPANGGGFDLDAIDKLLEKRVGNIDERIKKGIEDGMKEKGAELFKNATGSATNTMTGILKVSRRHKTELGGDFDPEVLDTWAQDEMKKGVHFVSVEDAYDKWSAPKREQKRIDDGIREGLKTRNSQVSVPGYTPPAANAPHKLLMVRGRTEGGAGSAVSAAAADLAARRQAS